MTAPWRKAVRDVWRGRARSTLVVLAMAIGLCAFLAVLSARAILDRELNRGYLATNPASAVLRTDDIDERLLASVLARGDVSDADARRVIRGRIRTSPTEWRRLILFVIRDFRQLRISTLTPEAGEWPPAPGDLLIERDAFQVARTRIGETVIVDVGTAGERTLRVAGGVHDPGQAQARMEDVVYGYIARETLAMLGEQPRLDRLYLLAGGNRLDEAHVRRVAAGVKTWLEASGHVVDRVDVPPPGQHPHAAIMGLLFLVMAVFGLLSLALAAVIVGILLLSIVAAERRQIGIMKSLGARRAQIARIYFAEAGLLGVAAVALATPAGIVGGRILARRLAVLLNFDLASMAVPPWVYLLVAIVGLLVPLAAAAYPVWTGTGITTRAALDAAGVHVESFGARRLDRLLSGVRAAGRPLLLGVRNAVRRRARTALTAGTLSVSGAFFISALSVRRSLVVTVDALFGAGTFGSASRYALDQHMLMIYVFLLVVSVVLAAVGGLGLMTATSLNVLERRRELAVLRAIGASPAMVAGIVVIESVFVAVLASVAAFGGAWALTSIIGKFLTTVFFPRGLVIALAPAGIAGWLGASTAMSAVAGLLPAVAASRHSIHEAITYE